MKDTRREIVESSAAHEAVSAALRATRELHAATETLLDAAAERYGINRNDLRCLEILEREGPMQPGRLATASGLSPAAITKVLDRLERAGYTTRSGDAGDRRARQVHTSDHHRRRREDIWSPVVEAATAALAERSPEELETLAVVLARLAAANRDSARRLRRH